MYIIKNSTPDTKGSEEWTTDKGRLEAEQMFTLVVYARRTHGQKRFDSSTFTFSSDGDRLCQAQAMVYNANGRELAKGDEMQSQPNTGWDTLNWTPPVKAPEWGARTEDGGKGRLSGMSLDIPAFPLDVFYKRKVEPCAQTKLNWQAKLIPLTSSRFREAVNSGSLPASAQSTLQSIEDAQFESMVHH
jgi:hypothetical protein